MRWRCAKWLRLREKVRTRKRRSILQNWRESSLGYSRQRGKKRSSESSKAPLSVTMRGGLARGIVDSAAVSAMNHVFLDPLSQVCG